MEVKKSNFSYKNIFLILNLQRSAVLRSAVTQVAKMEGNV